LESFERKENRVECSVRSPLSQKMIKGNIIGAQPFTRTMKYYTALLYTELLTLATTIMVVFY
jgi:hypothetical protein